MGIVYMKINRNENWGIRSEFPKGDFLWDLLVWGSKVTTCEVDSTETAGDKLSEFCSIVVNKRTEYDGIGVDVLGEYA